MKYEKDIEDRRILVTGAGGFVGSHLVDSLVEMGADVVAFVRSTSNGQLRNLDDSLSDIDVIRGDIQDPVSVQRAIQKLRGYEDVIVFHLAAQAHVGDSWKRPYETVQTNVVGTLNVLEIIKNEKIDVEKIDVAGTSEEFGNFDKNKEKGYKTENESVILDESSPLNPESIYATSKVAADFLAQNYYQAYGLPVITTRMFNNYGPRQSPRYITGTVITQALERDFVELGNLDPKRDMCFVEDGVRGHIAAAVEGLPGEVYTFGSSKTFRIEDWVNKILDIGEKEGYWEDIDIVQKEERYRPGNTDVRELKASYSKLNDLTGWMPETGTEEGIKKTIEWYAKNYESWKGICDWR